MSEISVTSSPRSDKQDIGAICDALEILAEKLDGSDAKNLLAAVDELLRAERIWSDLEDLAGELAEIQKLHKLDVASRPDVVGMVDLAGSILALDAICRFLRLRAPYDTLNLLLNGLRDLAEGGSPAAMFLPLERPKGRRPDVPTVMAAGGVALCLRTQVSRKMIVRSHFIAFREASIGRQRGIGLGMADALARAGCAISIWGRNPEKNARASARLRAHGGAVDTKLCDVSDRKAVERNAQLSDFGTHW
jgi:hypothetical protein